MPSRNHAPALRPTSGRAKNGSCGFENVSHPMQMLDSVAPLGTCAETPIPSSRLSHATSPTVRIVRSQPHRARESARPRVPQPRPHRDELPIDDPSARETASRTRTSIARRRTVRSQLLTSLRRSQSSVECSGSMRTSRRLLRRADLDPLRIAHGIAARDRPTVARARANRHRMTVLAAPHDPRAREPAARRRASSPHPRARSPRAPCDAPTARRTSRGRAPITRSALARIAQLVDVLELPSRVVVVQKRRERAVADHVAQHPVHQIGTRVHAASDRC